jgi:threonine/homoserine/homoserine lactone efflux protein
MRTFLFLCSALSLLLAAHKFSLAEPSGQYKGALFFLLMGIQMLVTGALIGEHQESQTPKSPPSAEKKDNKEAGLSAANASEEQGKRS